MPVSPAVAIRSGRTRGRAAAASLLPSLVGHRTLEESAYRDLKQAIAHGRFAPGERIVANVVAAAAGISRIPIMQALRRLESEGFVRITPHKDVVVPEVPPEGFRERFLIMAALETLCIREGARRVTPALVARLRALLSDMRTARAAGDTGRAVEADGQFHRTLWETAGLPHAAQILQNIWDRGEYYRTSMHARRGGFAAESLEEHEQIVKALEKRNFEAAARALERHRRRAMERMQHSMQARRQPRRGVSEGALAGL